MRNRYLALGACSTFLLATLLLTGCQTEASKKAMSKPTEQDAYSGFGRKSGKESERDIKKPDRVNDELPPEKAVELLANQLLNEEPTHFITAEEQLRYWGMKQGVDQIVVAKVRPLLKHPRVEVRAPALRLTSTYGKKDTYGDLIEVLKDESYGMRRMAYKTLKTKTGRDFGYSPKDGPQSRANAIAKWTEWWQGETQTMVAQQNQIGNFEVPKPPSTNSSFAEEGSPNPKNFDIQEIKVSNDPNTPGTP